MLLTSDQSLPRRTDTVGLYIRSIAAYAEGRDVDYLVNNYDWLPTA